MLRYAITDRGFQLGDGLRWAADGVDFVQLRDKLLPAAELLYFARSIREELHADPRLPAPKLLINGRPDVALAAGADGVHLTARAGELSPLQIREIFQQASVAPSIVSVSCHTLDEVERARDAGADLILFGPVFEKRVTGYLAAPGLGLCLLGAATALAPSRVLALGGVTPANASACLAAGAAGVAGIRLFA